MIRVLYVGMLWDYGNPSRGTSFEENSFHAGLRAHPRVEVTHFDQMETARSQGKEAASDLLVRTVDEGSFDCLFYVPFKDEISADALRSISSRDDIATVAWGCDDHWRFEDFSSLLAPALDWWVTTARSAVPKFEALGMGARVIKSQWAVEPTAYHPLGVPRDIAVSFVGQPHGERREIIEALAGMGVRVDVFGRGWEGADSRVTHEQMLGVFSRSEVSLNLSKSSVGDVEQIKGRVFEVPACRSLLLTDMADDLDAYYEIGEEIVVYEDLEDLAEKALFYSTHQLERDTIAEAGYMRTLGEHTWRQRFDDIFARMGLV